MNNIKAFPSKKIDYTESQIQERTVYEGHESGMDLRDYFAAKAMNAVMIGEYYKNVKDAEDVAKWAYAVADAMLKQREP